MLRSCIADGIHHRIDHITGDLRRQDPEIVGENDEDDPEQKIPPVFPEIFIERRKLFHWSKVRRTENRRPATDDRQPCLLTNCGYRCIHDFNIFQPVKRFGRLLSVVICSKFPPFSFSVPTHALLPTPKDMRFRRWQTLYNKQFRSG